MPSIIDKALQQCFLDSVKLKKLWQNASPASSFSAQTITIAGLNEYDLYAILYTPIKGENSYMVAFGKPGYASYLITVAKAAYGRRYISRSNAEEITFGNGSYNNADGENYQIPLIVYGLKILSGGVLN